MKKKKPGSILKILNIITAVTAVGSLSWAFHDDVTGFYRDLRGVSAMEIEERARDGIYLTDRGRLRQAQIRKHIESGAMRVAGRDDLERFRTAHDRKNPLRSVRLAWSSSVGIGRYFPSYRTLDDYTSRESAYVVLRRAGLSSGEDIPGEPKYLFIVESGASLSIDGADGMPLDTSDSLLFMESGAFRISGDTEWHRGFGNFVNPATTAPDVTPPPAIIRGRGYPQGARGSLPSYVSMKCPNVPDATVRGIWVDISGPQISGASPVDILLPQTTAPLVLLLTSEESTYWNIIPGIATVEAVFVASGGGVHVETGAPVHNLPSCDFSAPLNQLQENARGRMNDFMSVTMNGTLDISRREERPRIVDLRSDQLPGHEAHFGP